MAGRRACAGGLGLWALALLVALQGASGQMHTQMETFDAECDQQLKALWDAYQNPPVAPVAGCNKTCLNACYYTLEWAISSEKQQDCPLQVDIIRCFHVYRPRWLKFVQDCALWQYGLGAVSSGEASSPSTPSPAAEGAAPLPPAEGAAPLAPAAEGAAPSPPPAGLGRRRTLLQEAEAALGGADVANGCFPTFADYNEFEEYLNGEYTYTTYSSSAVGFTLSALYFSSLLLLGIGLPSWAKPWKKIKWGRRRNEPTKLPAPAAQLPAEAAVDGTAEETAGLAAKEAAAPLEAADGAAGEIAGEAADATAPPPPPLVEAK